MSVLICININGSYQLHTYILNGPIFDLIFLLFHAEAALQSLLLSLTSPPLTPTQHLEREQALAKQFAEILHFTLRFDELKVPAKWMQFSIDFSEFL